MCIFHGHSSVIGIFSIQEDNLKGNWLVDVGSLADHPNLKKNPNATVSTIHALASLASTVTQIIIDNGVSQSDFTELDLSRFSQLKQLEVGNHSLSYVAAMSIVGLNELESVEIGDNSFHSASLELKSNPIYSEWWLDMPSLKSLIFGREAFKYCSRVVFESDWLWCYWLNRLAWIDLHSNRLWGIPLRLWWFNYTDHAKWFLSSELTD